MLQAPSPTKVTRDARRALPLCSRTVCRSASSWQGWNSSVSALTTARRRAPPSSSSRSWCAVRHTIAAACRPSTRAVSSTDSRDAHRGEAAVDDHRVAAELGDAGREGDLGAQGRLVEDQRDRPRAGERLVRRTASALSSAARSRTSACSAGDRSSSRRKWRVMRWSPGAAAGRRRGSAGRAATSASRSAAVITSGGANRSRVGRGGVEDEAGLARRRRRPRRRTARRARAPASGPRRGTSTTPVWSASSRRASCSPRSMACVEQPVGARSCRGRRGRPRMRPGCRRRWCRGCRAGAAWPRLPDGDAVAPIGMPPPRPLASVTTSGSTRRRRELVGEPRAGAADAGLHLVEPEQGAVVAGDPLGGGEVAGGRDDDAGLALDRLEHDRGDVSSSTAASSAADVAVRHEGDVARQRLERLAVGGLGGERERAHGAAVEGALGGDQPGAAGAAGELERGLVGLGAGVAEEHRAPSDQPSRSSSRSARATCGSVAKKLETWPSVRSWVGDGLHERGVRVAEGVDGDAAEQVEVSLPSASQTWAPSPRVRASAGGPKVFITAPA